MKLKDLFKKLNIAIHKNLANLPKEMKKVAEASTLGRELIDKASRLGVSLEEILLRCEAANLLSHRAQLSSLIIDTSAEGLPAVLDGKERLVWFYVLLCNGRISPDFDLPVVQLNCSLHDGNVLDYPNEENSASNAFVNPAAIGRFLLQHWQADAPREEVLAHFVRRIVRHLSALPTIGRHATESMLLALELARYLPQVRIAEVLHRSEAWVSAAVSLGNLEETYLTALKDGQISSSVALILAEAATPEDRALLWELVKFKHLSTRSLRVALQFLRQNEGFARKLDALSKLMKLIEERLVALPNYYFARLKLIFRNRKPLWQVRFFHKKDKKVRHTEDLQTATSVDYRFLMAKLRAAEMALAQFPL